MNDMKRDRRDRRLNSGMLLSGAVLMLVASGCSKSSDSGSKPDVNETISIAPAANDKATFTSPTDAVPDPEGKLVYFLATSPGEGSAVFRSATDGTGLTKLTAGAPLASPFGITISDDGQTLFIADTGAETDTEEGGMIFALNVAGGKPSAVPGTEGTRPRGIEVAGDQIYFSGTLSTPAAKGKKATSVPAVFRTGIAGGIATPVVSGLPLKDPSGIAVTAKGDLYVLDTSASASKRATVFLVKDGAATEFLTDVAVGYPGGIALSQDDSTLLVSGLDDTSARDVVFVANIASKEMTTFTKSIDKFSESAGLHRARRAGVFAWADGHANKSGTVFVLK